MRNTPRAAAQRAGQQTRLPDRVGEHFAGFGVMGLPFDSGHYLALRRFPTNSIGPYSAVWHRDPSGRWVIYSDTPPNQSCARYFDAALTQTRIADIALDWPAPDRLAVTVEGVLEWTLQLRRTPATALLTGTGCLLPARLWRSPTVLGVLARLAGPLLRAGRLCLAGRAPNGQSFVANPRRLWAISASSALVHGVDIGAPAPLDRQARLGHFWLPQRGIFAIGEASFDAFDPSLHVAARRATNAAPQ